MPCRRCSQSPAGPGAPPPGPGRRLGRQPPRGAALGRAPRRRPRTAERPLGEVARKPRDVNLCCAAPPPHVAVTGGSNDACDARAPMSVGHRQVRSPHRKQNNVAHTTPHCAAHHARIASRARPWAADVARSGVQTATHRSPHCLSGCLPHTSACDHLPPKRHRCRG